MNILVLTTKTDHHLYFIYHIKKTFKDTFVIFEKKKIRFKFDTKHPYLKKRSLFEKKYFFKNRKVYFQGYKSFFDINQKSSIEYIKKINPSVIILFGVGLIKKKFLSNFKKKHIINLHGGDPEKYRGLDSMLWSLYHKDSSGLVSTLHYVDHRFDTGKIIYKKKINISNYLTIHSLRAINTKNCLYMTKKFLTRILLKKKVFSYKQRNIGRYYSAIPSKLIDISIKNLNKIKEK
tara:strand:+ start:22669 stop:23370 length:702 start_codon:yes stop_codon:yes gene_type:complete